MPPRIVAIIAAYNEERFIGGCLEHLAANGVEAYLCDNESTDRTVEIAESFRGRGLIGIETLPRDGTYRWRQILARKEQLAAELDADWFLHLDPDEILQSKVPGQTLAEAFAEADANGYNAVQSDELDFVPTRESPDHDHPDFRRTMRWYYPFEPGPLHHVNAWKRQPRVDLVSTGGHQAQFSGRRISPRRLFLRHYLILSHDHMLRKYAQRRYDAGEVRSGWHGWRARVTSADVRLPSRMELRFAADDTDLEASYPRRQHFIEWPVKRSDDPDPRPLVLCIVDRPAWAHDRKTRALAAALESEYRLVTRYQSEVSESDIDSADLVLLYYWLQVERLAHLDDALQRARPRLMIGACSEYELERALRGPGLRTLASLPRAVFANNWKLARQLEAALRREVFYTPNGVDTAFFHPAAAPPPPEPFRAGWAGSLTNQSVDGHRGVEEFIVPAVAAVEDAELTLAAREQRWRDAEEMRAFYQSLHVYVCASRSEGTPNPCLEAAACGVPIVTTAVGNMPEFIRDGENGFFVRRDVKDIAEKLRRLRDDPALRERMGTAARATAEEWDWRHHARPYAEMFKRMLDGRVPDPPRGAWHVRGIIGKMITRVVSRLRRSIALAFAFVLIAGAARAQVHWNARELAYLQSHGPIRMCVAPDWMPIEGIDRNGHHTGMAADFIRLMARRGGLNIQLVRTATWEESFALGERRQCDIFSLLMDSPSRRSFLDFTTPYLVIPGVIATSIKVPFVADLEQVRGKRLGHMRGFAGIELLRKAHPGIQLVEVDSYEEGLSKVQDGELYGFIGNMMSIGRALQENKMYDVKIAGRIGSDNLMSVATRNDQPVLHDIFQKLVDSIQPEERQEITNRWIAVRFEQGFDYRRLWQLLGVFLLVGVVTAFWARKLRRLNTELRAANDRLAETSRRDGLTGLYNRMYFDEMVGPTLHLCARNGLTMTLAVIDLDRFKDINDTFGHPFGDACLRQVAAVLQKTFRRDTDTTIRYGGEELIVISAGGTPEEMIERLEHFRREIEHSIIALDSRQSRLTLSIGVWSGVPGITTDPAQLLKSADAALYRAKRAGRNQLVVADSSSEPIAHPRVHEASVHAER